MYTPLAENLVASPAFSRFRARVSRIFRSILLVFVFMAVASAPTPSASSGRAAAPNRHDDNLDRVLKLILDVTEQARLSTDTAFAVRMQMQAALLLWPYDHDQARAIFRRAFQPLLRSPLDSGSGSMLEAARRQQLRVEVLDQIAGCDAEMAEALARAFAFPSAVMEAVSYTPSAGVSPTIATQGRLDPQGRELLVSVAMRLVEVNKDRAAALAHLSLGAGISPYFDRLLLRVRKNDHALANRLFSDAVDYLEQGRLASPGDIHTLSFYLISTKHPGGRDQLTRATVVKFLNLACDAVTRKDDAIKAEAARQETTIQPYQLYSTAKYLSELSSRYLPARAAVLQAWLAEQGDRQPAGPAGDARSTRHARTAPLVQPAEIEQAARNSQDERERDALYARAAFAWLARAEFQQAQQAAANIASADMRDRMLLAVARRLLAKARAKDALLIAPLVQDRAGKADLLIKLAQSAVAGGNLRCARTLLDLAGLEAAYIPCAFVRAQSLLAIAGSLSAPDSARAFTVMQEAVNAINEIPAAEPQALDAGPSNSCAAGAQAEDLFELGFAGSLTALARVDFDRALLMAQQLTGKEASLIAQLAVCRGGCGQKPYNRDEKNEH
jgi:hypothetical protein